ncbi:MAG: hypothetical protein MI807_01895 [Verrucomicrobiales bacterium]|nr:hypothetical protein [Verrucomicrobiales bacterium]
MIPGVVQRRLLVTSLVTLSAVTALWAAAGLVGREFFYPLPSQLKCNFLGGVFFVSVAGFICAAPPLLCSFRSAGWKIRSFLATNLTALGAVSYFCGIAWLFCAG